MSLLLPSSSSTTAIVFILPSTHPLPSILSHADPSFDVICHATHSTGKENLNDVDKVQPTVTDFLVETKTKARKQWKTTETNKEIKKQTKEIYLLQTLLINKLLNTNKVQAILQKIKYVHLPGMRDLCV